MALIYNFADILPAGTSLALLPLKACYFLLYTVVFTSLPYISIISTKIATFEQLSLLFAFGTILSTIGPIFVGFLGDKIGNYKLIIVITSVVAGFIHIPLLVINDGQAGEMAFNFTSSNISVLTESSSLLSPSTRSFSSVALMFVIRLIGFIGIDATLSLFDASAIALSRKFEGDFGRQKMWSTLSITTMPLLTGFIIDAMSNKESGYRNYTSAFCISAGSALLVLPILLKLDIQVERNSASLWDSAKKIIKMTDVVVFLFVQIVVGSCMGFHIIYLSVFIADELGGSSSLYGISLSCSGISGIIAFASVKILVERLGEVNTVAIGLLLYCMRFVAFNFINFPWLILASEIFDGFCGFLAYAAGSYFCAAAAPPGLLASLNGILSACTFGIGKGLGTTVGSALIAYYGMRATYCAFGILAGVTSISFLVIHHTFLKSIELERKAASSKGELTGGTMSSTVNLEKAEEETSVTILRT